MMTITVNKEQTRNESQKPGRVTRNEISRILDLELNRITQLSRLKNEKEYIEGLMRKELAMMSQVTIH